MHYFNFRSKTIPLTVGVLFCLLVGFAALAGWSGPTANPPGGNVDSPLNVSATPQTKAGPLTVQQLTASSTLNNKIVLKGSADTGNSVVSINAPGTAYSAVDFYSNGSNIWGIGRADTDNFYIDETGKGTRLSIEKDTGNVGIGTTAPGSYKLKTQGTGYFQGTNRVLTLSDNGAGGTPRLYIEMTKNPSGAPGIELYNIDTSDVATHTIGWIARDNKIINFEYPFGTSKAYIATSGYIWTGDNIQAAGDICSSGGTYCLNSIAAGGVGGSGTDNYIPIWNGTSTLGTSSIYQKDTGEVGIGTTGPTEKLEVAGNIEAQTIYAGVKNLVNEWQMESTGQWTGGVQYRTLVNFIDGQEVYAQKITESGTSCYDGWSYTNLFRINPNKTYEFSIWVKSTETDLYNYLGFHVYDAAKNRITGAWNNPYFKASRNDPNAWQRWSGYILPSYVTDADGNGVADSGSSKTRGTDWRWPSNAAWARMRFGTCYGDGSNTGVTYFAYPQVKEVDPDFRLIEGDLGIYGNVGIGTTAPGSYKLKTQGTGYFQGTNRVLALSDNGAGGTPRLYIEMTKNPSGAPGIELYNIDTSDVATHTIGWIARDNKIINFEYPFGTSKAYIATSGYIWTGDNIQAAGDICSSGGTYCLNSIAAGGVGGSGTDNYIPIWNGTNSLGTSSIYQKDTGNVGIGTTMPAGKLHVKQDVASASVGVRISRPEESGDPVLQFSDDDDNANTIRMIAGTNNIVIAPTNGRVGIRTTTPRGSLDVNGGIVAVNRLTLAIDTGTTTPTWNLDNNSDAFRIFREPNIGETGTVYMKIDNTGKVKINKNLEVVGTITADKITVDVVDPIYDINGTKYATYGHSTTGLKEETTGKIELSECAIDKSVFCEALSFEKAKKGSDLWLFSQITAFGDNWDDLIVSLTPQGRAQTWYEINPEEKEVIIFADKKVKVSYRLIAPRFDWPERDTNLAEDQDSNGMKIH